MIDINLIESSASAIWSWQFRIILVGDSTVGKSALLKRFTEGSFAETSDPTVRFENQQKKYNKSRNMGEKDGNWISPSKSTDRTNQF